jgi:hypothetical protein
MSKPPERVQFDGHGLILHCWTTVATIFQNRVDLKGARWVRLEVWDSAANGAFSQPVWLVIVSSDNGAVDGSGKRVDHTAIRGHRISGPLRGKKTIVERLTKLLRKIQDDGRSRP